MKQKTVLGICVGLVAITWLVFGQTLHHDFVNYDDDIYVYNNPIVTKGLTPIGVKWALTHSHARNWHPLSSISHMIDCQLFGLRAGGHHFINLVLHTVAAILLFLVLRAVTGALWRSAFVAAVFAIHPQHVESVAWVTERKDVLSAVFFMLTLAAYIRYVHAPSVARYIPMAILFALGLMSKSMLVTVPFVLLLLDYWPLGRFELPINAGPKPQHSLQWRRKLWRLIIEKIPLFVLSLASCVVVFLFQKYGGAQGDPVSLSWRLQNGVVSYVTYIWQMIWPVDLAPFYPHPETQMPVWRVACAGMFLLVVTVTACLRWRKNPYLVTGWLWYLGMLVPVIGIVEVGAQGWADRYTYLPHIGLYFGVTWLVADLSAGLRYRREIVTATAAVVLTALAWIAWAQASHWRDSQSLWTRALAVTTNNHVAHNNIGTLLEKGGQVDEALAHYQSALEIRSRYQTSDRDFMLALYHCNVANVLRRKGLLDQAIAHSQKAVQLQPDYRNAYRNLANALREKGRVDEAILVLRKCAQLHPEDLETQVNLGLTLLQKRMDVEAIAHFEKALQIAPQSTTALNNLAWLFATSVDPSIRNGARAVALAERAVRVSGEKDPMFLHKLAAAYAENGKFPEAQAVAERALQLASEQRNSALVSELNRNIGLYRTNIPLRDTSRSNVAP